MRPGGTCASRARVGMVGMKDMTNFSERIHALPRQRIFGAGGPWSGVQIWPRLFKRCILFRRKVHARNIQLHSIAFDGDEVCPVDVLGTLEDACPLDASMCCVQGDILLDEIGVPGIVGAVQAVSASGVIRILQNVVFGYPQRELPIGAG